MTVGEAMVIVDDIASIVEKCLSDEPLTAHDIDLIAEYLDDYSEILVNKKIED